VAAREADILRMSVKKTADRYDARVIHCCTPTTTAALGGEPRPSFACGRRVTNMPAIQLRSRGASRWLVELTSMTTLSVMGILASSKVADRRRGKGRPESSAVSSIKIVSVQWPLAI
jgi:hypothetical protein